MNKLELLRLFCTAAELGNFKETARLLAVSPQAVTRAVQQLEHLTGEVLFHRNTRQVKLTDFGSDLLQQARPQLEALNALLRPARQQAEHASGLIRLTAPSAFRTVLMPLLLQFSQRYPAIRLDLRFSDQHSAVVAEQIDLGLRIGSIRDLSFVAVPVGQMPMYLVASPAYLARAGTPGGLDDLAAHHFTGMLDQASNRPWPFYFAGVGQWQPAQIQLLANDAFAEREAALAGVGISQLPLFLLADALAAGQLVRLLPELEPAPWPISLYRPQRGPVALRIRLLFDFLQRQLTALSVLQ